MLRIPLVAKVLAAGAGAALLSLGLVATTAFAATNGGAPGSSRTAAHSGKKHDGKADRRAIHAAVFAAEAEVLGMTPDQLRDAVKHGQSVSDLAQARGITKDQFAERLAVQVKPSLDGLVDSKKITPAQEDHVLAAIRTGHIPGWERDRHHPKAA